MIARPKTIKPKTCRVCRTDFHSSLPMAKVCGPMCALSLARSVNGKAKKVAQVKEAKVDREKKQASKTIATLIREAQTVFNAFIRERDRQAGQTCISSGRSLDWSGNGVDAGHYRSRGAAAHLRFNEDNCHAQSKQENRYASGNVVDYRIRLIVRIGLPRVEALEADNTVHKWGRAELIAIKATYAQKLKEMKGRAL